jgi:hypothetical protein
MKILILSLGLFLLHCTTKGISIEECTKLCKLGIKQYRTTSGLFRDTDCSCFSEWEHSRR